MNHDGDEMKRFLLIVVAAAALSLSACAPSGYHHNGSLLDGPAAAFTASPNDDCKRTDVMQGIVTVLNGKIGKPDGPPAQVISASPFTAAVEASVPGTTSGWMGGVLSCRGILQTAAGPIGPGIVQVRGDTTPNNNGTIAAFSVLDAKWETDADRDRREALARKEQAERIAAAPARAAKTMDDMRKSAKIEPNKTVYCGVGRSQFWTTNAICYAMIEEVKNLSGKIKTESRFKLVEECANDIAKKLPGKDEPTYMNACEKLIDTYFN
jgi:hypothetical protein